MSKEEKIAGFDPSGVGIKNGNFIGMPFDEHEAEIILMPVPWDVTVSFKEGTANGAINILEASRQLDLFDPDVPNAWKIGYHFLKENQELRKLNTEMRPKAAAYISHLESGTGSESEEIQEQLLSEINQACKTMVDTVYQNTHKYLRKNKLVGLVGGDHSSPLGYYKALAEHYGQYCILVIDAHLDLRVAYEGFTYSHASIYYNTMQIPQIQRLVQVGIRDYCESERNYANKRGHTIDPFYDQDLHNSMYRGTTWDTLCKNIVDRIPEQVAVSIDIDGLKPYLCPNTGTPVPGGLEFQQVIHLLKCILERGKTIIGFDICEVAGEGAIDGNVGARLLYKLGNLAAKSQNRHLKYK